MEIVTLLRSRTCILLRILAFILRSYIRVQTNFKKTNPVNHTHLKAKATTNHRPHKSTLPSQPQPRPLLLS